MPEFLFDVPEPVLIDHYVQETIDDMKKHGFSGDDLFLGAHSLGGVMSQQYVASNQDMFKGLILTGSGLLNDTRKILDDGTTEFSIKTPSLTIGGSKDGLFRVSRGALSYYH